MEKQNRKVICIKAEDDKEYEQIIFVMKDEKSAISMKNKGKVNLVLEAEKIINQKLEKSTIFKASQNAVIRKEGDISQLIIKRSSTFDIALNICMMAGCLFLAAALMVASR